MDCQSTRTLMSQYAAGELPDNDMQKIKVHVNNCPSCKEEYQLQKVMEQTLLEAVRAPMPWITTVYIWANYLPIPGRAIPLYACMAASIILGISISLCLDVIDSTTIMGDLSEALNKVYNSLSFEEISYISKYFPNVSSISDSQISITLITSALLSLFMLIFLQKIIKILLSAIVPVSPNK